MDDTDLMYYQNDKTAPFDFQHYACLFSSLLYSRPASGGADWSIDEAVDAWKQCRALGIISGDLNGDGDYDDAGEDEIQRYSDLFTLLMLPLEVVPASALGRPLNASGRVLPVSVPLGSDYWVIEAWHWKITHFVVNDGTGKKPVRYDPIRNGSLTVKNGIPQSLRVFRIKR